MAKTTYATGNALTRKAWNEKLFRDAAYETPLSGMMGSGSDACVQVKTDLEGKKGDRVTFGIRKLLTGAGVSEGTPLEGNEEALVTYDFNVTLGQKRHAVRDDGTMSRQRTIVDIPEEARSALKDWMSERIERDSLDALGLLSTSSVAPSKIFYRNSSGVVTATAVAATAKSGLDATNSKLNTDLIVALKTYAMTGGNRTMVPLRPIKTDGERVYVLMVHPDCLYDLEVDSNFEAAHRDAMERGKTNPLFKGAVAYWRGVIVRSNELIGVGTDGGGGSVAWARSALLGAQALCWAWGERPEVVEKEFDYDNEMGWAIGMIRGVAKPVFNSVDYGSLGVYLARTNISGL
jgi:N4-gp56 family major capsid protein